MTKTQRIHQYLSNYVTVESVNEHDGDNPKMKDLVITVNCTPDKIEQVRHRLMLSTLDCHYNRIKIVRSDVRKLV